MKNGAYNESNAGISGLMSRIDLGPFAKMFDVLKGIVNIPGGISTTGTGSRSSMSSPGSPSLSGSLQDKARMMYEYIKSKGYSSAQAKGIVANIHRESHFDPMVRSGDDGGPGGLFQWKGVRQTAEVARLVNSGNWRGQIDYALRRCGAPISCSN